MQVNLCVFLCYIITINTSMLPKAIDQNTLLLLMGTDLYSLTCDFRFFIQQNTWKRDTKWRINPFLYTF